MDTLTPELRSQRMASVRGRGNRSTELRMIALFRSWGITGWRRNQKLVGRPDFLFRRERVAIFVDGDFWHGHPRRCRLPKTNVEFWTAKIARNRRRDREVGKWLRANGWTVVRIWESSLASNPTGVARRVEFAIAKKNS